MTIAKADGVGFVLESPTWRASADWGDKLGYTRDQITAANRDAIGLMLDLRAKHDWNPSRWSSAAASGRAATATTRAR